jgi:putative two-component system response regulator
VGASVHLDVKGTTESFDQETAKGLSERLLAGDVSDLLCEDIRAYFLGCVELGTQGLGLLRALIDVTDRFEVALGQRSTIEALRLGGVRAHTDVGDYVLAAQAALAALKLQPPKDLRIRILKSLGMHFIELGSLDRALDATLEALTMAQEAVDEEQVAGLLNNIGVLLWHDSPHLAESFWKRAMHEAPAEVAGDVAIACRTNLARCALHRADGAEALQWAQESVELARQSSHLPEGIRRCGETLAASFLVRARLLTNGPDDAYALAVETLEAAGHTGPGADAAAIAMALVRAKQSIKAESPNDLLKVLHAARQRNRPAELADLLAVVADFYESVHQPEEALRYLRELCELHKETKATALRVAAQLHITLPPDDAGLVRRRASLESELGASAQARLQMAVNAGLACGYDEAHPFRKARLAQLLGEVLGWNTQAVIDASNAAALCDIGMIAIPTEICKKTRGLSEGQLAIVREHVDFGARLLGEPKLRSLEDAVQAARTHHAHWDGSGYPQGLAREDIPIIGRVVALCSTFESLTHERPWRPALPVNAALLDIERLSGKRFDPELSSQFVKAVRETYWQVRDWEGFLCDGVEVTPFYRARRLVEGSRRS